MGDFFPTLPTLSPSAPCITVPLYSFIQPGFSLIPASQRKRLPQCLLSYLCMISLSYNVNLAQTDFPIATVKLISKEENIKISRTRGVAMLYLNLRGIKQNFLEYGGLWLLSQYLKKCNFATLYLLSGPFSFCKDL